MGKSKKTTTKARATKPAAPAAEQPTRPVTPDAPKRLSALDAAAKVLAEEGRPLSCQELIGRMAGKAYWVSPGGKTPAATLHSAMTREITPKGEQSRFRKAGPGRFTLNAIQ
jgi:hypothetical protein